MASPRYCRYCKRMVTPIRRFNWAVMILCFIIFIVPGVLYVVYASFIKPKVCPICNGRNWGMPPQDGETTG